MKKLFSLIIASFLVVITFNLYAQDYDDVVYLKNGSVIRGVIIEQVPNESLKIQTKDGNLFVYKFSEVQKMTKEMPFSAQARNKYAMSENKVYSKSRTAQFNKPKGYFGLVELGFAPSVNRYETLRISATVINGYRVLPQFAIGVGVGLQGYVDYGELTIPIFAHLRSDFLDKKVSPFVAFNIGYNLSALGGYYSGLMMEPSLGTSFNVGDIYRMTAGLGFSIDRVQGFLQSQCTTYRIKDWAVALNIKVGFSF